MERIYAHDLDIDLQTAPVVSKEGGIVYKSNDGELIKVYNSVILENEGKDLVEKLSYPEKIDGVVGPNKLIYVHDRLIGYTMDNIKGKNDIEYEEGLDKSTRNNLYRLADKYMKLEKLVKNASDDVVFPGLLDRENIIIDNKNNIHIMGYDNIQIGNKKAIRRSDYLGDSIEFFPKYFDGEKYTKELDIRSLTLYYIQMAFGLNLKDGYNNLDLRRALGDTYAYKSILDKIALIHDPEEPNEYLGNDVYAIAGAYDLIENTNKSYKMTKKLRQKWME